MMCIGNRVNFEFILDNLKMFAWDGEIMILWNIFSILLNLTAVNMNTGHKGDLCGSVALQYTWKLLTF